MADSDAWRVRKGQEIRRFSDRLVVQRVRAGMLDLSVCLLVVSPAPQEMLGLLRPLAAAAASEGIRRDTGIVSWLHWPDLVTIDGRVVAKASVRSATSPGSGATQVVVTISVNCFSSHPRGFPSALPSTSILNALGVKVDAVLLRDKILHAVNWYFAEWQRGMNWKLAERIRPTIPWLGREVEVRAAGAPPSRGKAKGVDDFGSLLLLEDADEEGSGRIRRARTISPEAAELVRVLR